MAANIMNLLSRILIITLFMGTASFAFDEPVKTRVESMQDQSKAKKLKQLADSDVDRVFDDLKNKNYQHDRQFMRSAVFEAYKNRPKKAVNMAIRRIMNRPPVNNEEYWRDRAVEENIVRNIFKMFPEEAAEQIQYVFYSSEAHVRGNMIRTAGTSAGGIKIRDILEDSLDDKAFCEPEVEEVDGLPLRVCDVAYNQLVLRYRIPNVLRTIGTSHSVVTRDYHIDRLKEVLNR
jgi:hypothetical protein